MYLAKENGYFIYKLWKSKTSELYGLLFNLSKKKKKENEIKGLRGSDKYVALSTLST